MIDNANLGEGAMTPTCPNMPKGGYYRAIR